MSSKPQTSKIILGAMVAVVALPSIAFAGGPKFCSVVDPIWRAGHRSSETQLTAAVDASAAAVTAARTVTVDALMAALKVSTKQRSVNGERESTARTSSAKAASQVYVEQKSAEEIRKAHETYGVQGQAIGGCAAVETLAKVTAAVKARKTRAEEIVRSGAIDTIAGSAESPLRAAGRRLAFDKPEAVSAAAFFDGRTSAAMKDAYLNNLVGLPVALPSDMTGVSNQIQFVQARRIQAIRSPAIVSLAAVRAATEDAGHYDVDEAAGGSIGYMKAMDVLISQYGGGSEYEQWSAALVTKSSTGLLKEIARLRSVSLMLGGLRNDSADRRQAVIGALLAGEAVQ